MDTVTAVPRLSAFYGIVIRSGDIVAGELPRRQANLVLQWAALHRDELLAAWARASAGEPPGTIDPLP